MPRLKEATIKLHIEGAREYLRGLYKRTTDGNPFGDKPRGEKQYRRVERWHPGGWEALCREMNIPFTHSERYGKHYSKKVMPPIDSQPVKKGESEVNNPPKPTLETLILKLIQIFDGKRRRYPERECLVYRFNLREKDTMRRFEIHEGRVYKKKDNQLIELLPSEANKVLRLKYIEEVDEVMKKKEALIELLLLLDPSGIVEI